MKNLNLIPKVGAFGLRFGMDQTEVKELIGEPDKVFRSESGDLHYCFIGLGIALRFDVDSGERLAWIDVANPNAEILDLAPIGKSIEEVILQMRSKLGEIEETEDYGIWSSRTFPDAWIELQETLGWVTQINMGVCFAEDNSPQWPG